MTGKGDSPFTIPPEWFLFRLGFAKIEMTGKGDSPFAIPPEWFLFQLGFARVEPLLHRSPEMRAQAPRKALLDNRWRSV